MSDENNKQRRDYVVLWRTDDGLWKELAEVAAYSAANANVTVARQLDTAELDAGVELHAVSARAWAAGYSRLKAQHDTRIVPS